MGSIATAIINILQFFSDNAQLKAYFLWTMGDLTSISNSQVIIIFPIILLGIILLFLFSKNLNLYLLGENYAQSLGVNIKKSRIRLIIIISILTGTITTFCGPIGFIGIIVPHIAKIIFKTSDHRKLIPISILIGIGLLLLADILSQLPFKESVIPINSLTAIMGIPFILWLILKEKKQNNID